MLDLDHNMLLVGLDNISMSRSHFDLMDVML